jgi:hypothetical protein
MAGLVGGPIVMYAFMCILNCLEGATFTGLELLAAPPLGGILGGAEGFVLGLLWAVKPRRLTLWWLMVVVASMALLLGLFAYSALFGLMALTFPVMMLALTKAAAGLVDRSRAAAEARRGHRSIAPVPQSTAWLNGRATRREEKPLNEDQG